MAFSFTPTTQNVTQPVTAGFSFTPKKSVNKTTVQQSKRTKSFAPIPQVEQGKFGKGVLPFLAELGVNLPGAVINPLASLAVDTPTDVAESISRRATGQAPMTYEQFRSPASRAAAPISSAALRLMGKEKQAKRLTGGQTAQDALADVGSYVEPFITLASFGLGAGAKELGKQAVKETVKKTAFKGALKTAPYGAAYGLAGGLEAGREAQSTQDQLTQALISAGLGGVIGGAVGAGGAVIGRQLAKAKTPKTLGEIQKKSQIEKGVKELADFDEAAKRGDIVQMQKIAQKIVSAKEGTPLAKYKNTPLIQQYARELAPGEKQRAFLETAVKSPKVTEPVRAGVQQVQPQTYMQIANKEAVAKADNFIAKQGIDKARDYALGTAPMNDMKGALHLRLLEKYQQQGNNDLAVQMIESFDKQAREAGRFIQLGASYGRLTPSGMERWVEKTIEKVNARKGVLDWVFSKAGVKRSQQVVFTDAMKGEIRQAQSQIIAMPDGEAKNQATKALMEKVGEWTPPGISEMFDYYRYTNMLSGPKTQGRNIGENMGSTFIARPWDLGTKGSLDWIRSGLFGKPREAYVKDVPQYYKDAYNAFPSAWKAAMQVWKKELDIAKPDIAMEATRMKQVPGVLTMVQRFMEAADRFNSTIIAAGEKARLMKSGVDESSAITQANKLAQKYLYRATLDPKDKSLPLATRALTSLTHSLEELRRKPVIGGPISWFIPFIRTPMNKSIEMLERTPIGLIGGQQSLERTARVINGSIVMGAGALLAHQGMTTWAAPRDQKERELFYASGRKPFSINIGNTWVPMWYLGPFALAFAIPAATKYFHDDAPRALADSELNKIGKTIEETARFVTEQTSLSGTAGLLRILEGDETFSADKFAAFTAGQVIPADALIRYINTIVDATYRKPKGFIETIMRDIPGLSQGIEPYLTPSGEEAKREPIVNGVPIYPFLPYDIGIEKPIYEPKLERRQQELQRNALRNKRKKEREERRK